MPEDKTNAPVGANTNISVSPLSEADPTSLDELFLRIDKKLILGIPREITEFEIESVVEYYLKERTRFIYDLEHNIKTPKERKSKPKNLHEALKNLDFD